MLQYNLVEMVRKTLCPSNFVLKASDGIQEMEHMDIIYEFIGKKNLKKAILPGHIEGNCTYL
jgi:hypothetical protein